LCCAVELTYNYGVDSYDIGEGFGHFGVALPDVYKAADNIKALGGEVRARGRGGTARLMQ
jgi:lactoylglutathione lyase